MYLVFIFVGNVFSLAFNHEKTDPFSFLKKTEKTKEVSKLKGVKVFSDFQPNILGTVLMAECLFIQFFVMNFL